MHVLERIKELMERKGWTCYELSMQTGISTNAIYDWFKIGAIPSLGNIIKICEAMGISLEYFFGGEDTHEPEAEERRLTEEWFALSDLEKQTIWNLLETFHILKNDRR